MAVPDGVWNHGEGFGLATADQGGWHGATDGTNLTIDDVHVRTPDIWVPYLWRSDDEDLYPGAPHNMLRMEGYLRPAGLGLPVKHPIYGALGAEYVDQGAFELFKPLTPYAGQKILIVIHNRATAGFPLNKDLEKLRWRQLYRGIYSPDGLVRDEPPGGFATAADFLNADSNDGLAVERPILNTIVQWPPGGQEYWPIEGYAVLSVMHRSTTLNEQRNMQLLQAIKLLLMEDGPRNPVGAANKLTPQQVGENVVVVFAGGSNGGMQSSLATLRYPELIHGCYAEVINPSYQRLYAEFDLTRALTQLTAAGMGPLEVTEDDFLWWNQYVWAQGLEMHDMSYLRHFVAGTSYRPTCFAVGDEDATSSGVNWVGVIEGMKWAPSGVAASPSSWVTSAAHTFGWMAGANARHQGYIGKVVNPYTTLETYFSREALPDLCEQAVDHRAAEVAAQFPPIAPLVHEPRSPAQQFRGLDDPQEWWLGRPGDDLPTPDPADPLILDTAFVDAVNPGATGCMPGGKEAMFIRDGRVYVGSADGFVTWFSVDQSISKMPLVRGGGNSQLGRSPRLGHGCFALASADDGGEWCVVAATRRHLYKLHRDTLQVLASRELPWEVAEPHHIAIADVLGFDVPQILFASVHGGLCFYGLDLAPLHEWPEPGILDFFVDGPGDKVTILSSRGHVATVSFSVTGSGLAAQLEEVSSAIPLDLTDVNTASQGRPFDLERMLVNINGIVGEVAISTWRGDLDGDAVRAHWMFNLQQVPYVNTHTDNLKGILDIAACSDNSAQTQLGDHCIVLHSGKLQLFDPGGVSQGEVSLTQGEWGGHYPFGEQAHRIVVGELVDDGLGGYPEEVVVATNTGLMWLHINEIAATGTTLPGAELAAQPPGQHGSGFWVEKNGPGGTALTTTQVQARTNQAMQATWAMARKPDGAGLDSYLHLLDQRGAYWRVGYDGGVELRNSLPLITGSRSWAYVGSIQGGLGLAGELSVFPGGLDTVLATFPYGPIQSDKVYLQTGANIRPNNWLLRSSPQAVFDGFFLSSEGVSVLQDAYPAEVWHWSYLPVENVASQPVAQWGNLVQGMKVEAGSVTGIWDSTGDPILAGANCPYHPFRSHSNDVVSISQQSIAAVRLMEGGNAGSTVVVLGCPGGRVRILRPPTFRTASGQARDLGSLVSIATPDHGMGCSALAVRHESLGGGSEQVRIWFGTMSDPDPRPVGYSNPMGSLAPEELGAGAIHSAVWTPGNNHIAVLDSVRLSPQTLADRGASAVVGLAVADLLPTTMSHPEYAGVEVIATTLSGDVFVYSEDLAMLHFRSHVHGAAGCYNSVVVADLGGDNHMELYVAGSTGLWRFVVDGEL